MKKILFAISIMGAAACTHHGDEHAADDMHDHASQAVQQTLFSDHLEFFMEHELLEAGEEAAFLLHITHLPDYSPCTCGNLQLHMGTQDILVEKADRPGIYIIPFTPEKTGEIHMDIRHSGAGYDESVQLHLMVHERHGELHEEENGPVEEHGHAGVDPGEISFLKELAWKSDFRVDPVRPGEFHTVIPSSGELVPLPGDKKNVMSTTRGMVHFSEPLLVQGSHVKKGQLLFTISSEDLVEDNVQIRRESARIQLEKSRGDYLRHRDLFEKQAIAERLLLESLSIYTEDSLTYYNLEHHVNGNGVRILAPASGSIHALDVSDGLYVQEGQVLAILSPDRQLILRADLPQQYYGHSEEISTAHFRTAYSDEVWSVKDLGGRLLSVGHSVMENDHYIPVTFLLENRGNLLEGAFAEVYLLAGHRDNVLSIPASALGEEQGGKYVFVQVTGESYTKRRVQTGSSDGRCVEILSGLSPGERIVTRGTMMVKAASLETSEFGHGHQH